MGDDVEVNADDVDVPRKKIATTFVDTFMMISYSSLDVRVSNVNESDDVLILIRKLLLHMCSLFVCRKCFYVLFIGMCRGRRTRLLCVVCVVVVYVATGRSMSSKVSLWCGEVVK